jgi:hypothetical protein
MIEVKLSTHAAAIRYATDLIERGIARFVRIDPVQPAGYVVRRFDPDEWKELYGQRDATETISSAYDVRDFFYNSANKGRQTA